MSPENAESPAYDVRVAAFTELDSRTAYLLWALRESVFVVEQACAYQELDGRDLEPGTRHLWAQVDGEPVGYLRILDEGDHARIGRVLVVAGTPRRRPLGRADAGRARRRGRVGHRCWTRRRRWPGWYAGFGYVPDGAAFIEDGIPHTPMRRPAE